MRPHLDRHACTHAREKSEAKLTSYECGNLIKVARRQPARPRTVSAAVVRAPREADRELVEPKHIDHGYLPVRPIDSYVISNAPACTRVCACVRKGRGR